MVIAIKGNWQSSWEMFCTLGDNAHILLWKGLIICEIKGDHNKRFAVGRAGLAALISNFGWVDPWGLSQHTLLTNAISQWSMFKNLIWKMSWFQILKKIFKNCFNREVSCSKVSLVSSDPNFKIQLPYWSSFLWVLTRDIHIECSKQFKWNLYFYGSGQSGPFGAELKLL